MRFVCWLYRGRGFWKDVARYDERHPIMLARMLQRCGGHRLTCVHDGSFDIPQEISTIVMPKHVAALPDYQPKLWAWSREFQDLIGERFASIDLDVLLVGDSAPILSTADRFRIWDQAFGEPYNSSLFVLEPGFGNEVWDSYSVEELYRVRSESRQNGKYWTGDQSWIAHVLGPDHPTFSEADGIIQYRPKYHRAAMPSGMIAGFMCGPYEPFSEAEKSEWVRQLYR